MILRRPRLEDDDNEEEEEEQNIEEYESEEESEPKKVWIHSITPWFPKMKGIK